MPLVSHLGHFQKECHGRNPLKTVVFGIFLYPYVQIVHSFASFPSGSMYFRYTAYSLLIYHGTTFLTKFVLLKITNRCKHEEIPRFSIHGVGWLASKSSATCGSINDYLRKMDEL